MADGHVAGGPALTTAVAAPATARPALWLPVAAALIASLATNLLLPRAEPETGPSVLSRPAPTSEGLSAFYAEVCPAAPNRSARD